MTTNTNQLVRAARLADVQRAGCLPVQVNGHTLALFAQDGRVFAVDNRCPHMGFPLHRGTVRDGILTCHWHHARFDLASGGTFDQWADDVAAFPVELRDGEVWVDLAPHAGRQTHLRQRLNDGLERNIPLVMAKAIIGLLDGGSELAEPFRLGLDFGVRYRRNGWGQGLTILTCMVNLLPYLQTDDRPRALYHGLSAVANDSDGAPPRFMVNPLPSTPSDPAVLKRWFRQFIEVRDDEGAERCIISAIRAGADNERMADMLFAAATDHRYIQIGHPLDFTNKAFEALDAAGWSHAERVLTSLVTGYAMASRMEESNAWRYPIDLIAILDTTFEQLPAVLAGSRWPVAGGKWQVVESGRPSAVGRPSTDLVAVLLGEDPQAIADALLAALREGVSPVELAGVVAYTAALRIARFHTSNEFSDWDTALHTFTFANAVHRGLRRTPSAELVRGIFDAAMSV
ncbi:MAG: Rieske 2Fe-2S domain-containing protein, partial [Chloroflexota bacterium]